MDEVNTSLGSQNRLLWTLEQLLAIEATEVKSALDQASLLVSQALKADKVDIFFYEPTTTTLVAVGVSDTPLGHKQRAIGMDRLPIANGGRTVYVYQTGNTYWNGHTEQDPEELVGIVQGLGIRSSLAVPLVVNGERRGVLNVTSQQPELFSEADHLFVLAVARWIGTLVHRAELVEQIAQDAAAKARRVAADELVTILAHDLSNYLTPLAGRISLLARRALREGRQRDLQDAQTASLALDRLRRLINDLLDASRLEQGVFSLSKTVIDLVDLVRQTVDMLRSEEADIAIQGLEELVIEVDPNRIRQALENLLSNARKYSPPGVPIIVEVASQTRDDGNWAVVSVRDSGPGISPDLMPRLFNRFVTGPGSGGLGLGLYITRGIAEAHGGTLTAESHPHQGTTFYLSLPAQ